MTGSLLKNKFGAILDYIDSNEMKQKLVIKVLERHIYNLERDPNSMATKKKTYSRSTLFRKDSSVPENITKRVDSVYTPLKINVSESCKKMINN